MNDLAQDGCFDKGSITKAIAKLEEMGFVRVETSDVDKRAKKLYTTLKTKQLMPKLYRIRQEWTNYLSKDLSEEEKNNYLSVMDKLLTKAKEYSKTSLDETGVKFYGLQKLSLLDFPGKMAATLFTGGCNFRCPFCHNKHLVFLGNEKEIESAKIMQYLESRKNILDGICISGGEPLLHEGIEDFLREIRKTNLKIKLDTNGSFPDKLKSIVDEGLVDYVAMDVKNTKRKYNQTIGLEGYSIKDIEKSIEYLKENHVDYEFRITLVKEYHENTNFNDLGEWLKGAKCLYLQSFEDHGTCIKEGLHALNNEKILEIKETLKPYIEKVEIRGQKEEK